LSIDGGEKVGSDSLPALAYNKVDHGDAHPCSDDCQRDLVIGEKNQVNGQKLLPDAKNAIKGKFREDRKSEGREQRERGGESREKHPLPPPGVDDEASCGSSAECLGRFIKE